MCGPCKVLIVDDEVLIRKGLKHYINWEQEGFTIVGEASNGKEALEKIEKIQPNIVITDIVMPLIDGEELTKLIKERYPTIEVIILSSFGDFEYVRSTFQSGIVDYILKPTLNGPELLKALKTVAQKLSFNPNHYEENAQTIDGSLDKLMSGFEVKMDVVDYMQVLPYSHFALLAINGDSLSVNEIMATFQAQIMSLEHVKWKAILDQPEFESVTLLNFSEQQFQQIVHSVHSIANTTDVVWFISDMFQKLQSLKEVYDRQLIKLLQYQFYLPKQSVYFYKYLPVIQKNEEKFDLDHFTDLFKKRQFTVAISDLKYHIQKMANHLTVEVHEFKSFLGNIIFNMIIILNNMQLDVKELDQKKYNYFSRIDSAEHVNEALELMDSFMEEVLEVIEAEKMKWLKPNLLKLLEFIDEHYSEPISLSTLAKQFHFNPSYLSTYFSTHVGESFSEYLNKVRIKKSLELLEANELSISEISDKVGYSDHSYYCRVFKNMMGMSPSLYQKQQFKLEREKK